MKKEDLEFFGTGAVIGACIGLGLSFAALSPLVIGGIIGFLPITALYIKGFLNDKVCKTKECIPNSKCIINHCGSSWCCP